MELRINLLKNQNRKGSKTIYEKNKNKNEFKPRYKKMGWAVARPSPLLGPLMVQMLHGHLTAWNQFSRFTDKYKLFFQALKKARVTFVGTKNVSQLPKI